MMTRLDGPVERIQRHLEVAQRCVGAKAGPEPIDELIVLQPPAALGQKQLDELPGLVVLPLARCDLRLTAPRPKRAQRLNVELVTGMHLDVRKASERQQACNVSRAHTQTTGLQQQWHDAPGSGGPSKVGTVSR